MTESLSEGSRWHCHLRVGFAVPSSACLVPLSSLLFNFDRLVNNGGLSPGPGPPLALSGSGGKERAVAHPGVRAQARESQL